MDTHQAGESAVEVDSEGMLRVLQVLPDLYVECSPRSLQQRIDRAFKDVTGAVHATVREGSVARRRRAGLVMEVIPIPSVADAPVEARLYFASPPSPVVLATAHRLATHVARVLQTGAGSCAPEELPGPTELVGWVETDQGRALVLRRSAVAAVEGLAGLTPRQATAALLASDGLTNQEIADVLGVSIHTVSNHLRAVFRELGVSSREALATRLIEGSSP